MTDQYETQKAPTKQIALDEPKKNFIDKQVIVEKNKPSVKFDMKGIGKIKNEVI